MGIGWVEEARGFRSRGVRYLLLRISLCWLLGVHRGLFLSRRADGPAKVARAGGGHSTGFGRVVQRAAGLYA